MINYRFLIPLVLAFFAVSPFTGCEDEIEINAPYDDVTVVVGLLDPAQTTHIVKINRLFVGEQNALILAKDRSEAEYNDLSVEVREYIIDQRSRDTTATNRSWTLRDTLITEKDSGTFYYPDQKAYAFDAQLRNPDGDNERYPYYEIVIQKPDGETVRSGTPIVEIPTISGVAAIGDVFPSFGSWANSGVAFMNGNTAVNSTMSFPVRPPVNTKGLEMDLEFRWREVDDNFNTLAERSIQIGLGNKVLDNVPETTIEREEVSFGYNGEGLFNAVANATQPISETPELYKRVLSDTANLKITLWLAGEELQTFIDLNSPSQTLLEEKPAYSNIENGIGVWSSRTRVELLVTINQATARELVDGLLLSLTADRGFCNPFLPSQDPDSCAP